jgi:hypothetical protein
MAEKVYTKRLVDRYNKYQGEEKEIFGTERTEEKPNFKKKNYCAEKDKRKRKIGEGWDKELRGNCIISEIT